MTPCRPNSLPARRASPSARPPHLPPRRRLPVRLLPQAQVLPPGGEHAGKPHVEEVFEHRWRKAYEVRALEREGRHANSQVWAARGRSGWVLCGRVTAIWQRALCEEATTAARTSSCVACKVCVQARANKLPGLSDSSACAAPQAGSQCGSGAGSRSTSPSKARPTHASAAATGVATAADALAAVSLASSGARGAESEQQKAAVGEQAQEGQRAGQPALRQQEVEDEDDDELATGGCCPGQDPSAASGCSANGSAAQLPAGAAADAEGLLYSEGEEEEAEPEIKLVWDSSSRRPGGAAAPAVARNALSPGAAAAVELKEQGNTQLKEGDCAAAVKCYTQALAVLREASQAASRGAGQAAEGAAADAPSPAAAAAAGAGAQLAATLHSNRAHALLRLRRNEEVSGRTQLDCGVCCDVADRSAATAPVIEGGNRVAAEAWRLDIQPDCAGGS